MLAARAIWEGAGAERANSAPARPAAAGALACILTALGALAVVEPQSASPATAGTAQFRGVNWARLGGDFHGGPLVRHGLSGSDSYQTVVAATRCTCVHPRR